MWGVNRQISLHHMIYAVESALICTGLRLAFCNSEDACVTNQRMSEALVACDRYGR